MKYTTLLRNGLTMTTCVILAACAGTGTTGPNATDTSGKIDAALRKAADETSASGAQGENLGYVEKMYKRDPAKAENAIRYAVALREADAANKAAIVLAPFADDPKSPVEAKQEFAAIQLALGNNQKAEKYAQKAVLQNPDDAKAFHFLGIALDAQGKHPEAERAFRKALDMWEGDPVPIMNNLALNLSSQGFLDEASEILTKAKTIAPGRIEIERNLRIVNTLRQSENPTTPKPLKRPKASEDVKTSVDAKIDTKADTNKAVPATKPAKKD